MAKTKDISGDKLRFLNQIKAMNQKGPDVFRQVFEKSTLATLIIQAIKRKSNNHHENDNMTEPSYIETLKRIPNEQQITVDRK